MADDIDFTFDTSFFDKGVKKVMKGFSSMEMTASKVAKGVNRGLTSMVGKLGLVFAGFKTVKSAILDMPEIGQAFGIAKDIFSKNLLFPLRKEIFPLLQKMLDWVRDSRVRFVKWGQVIANVFRGMVSGIKRVIEFAKDMSNAIANFADRLFGDRIKSVEELFNLITFKFATVAQFVGAIIEQIGGSFSGGILGETLELVTKITKSFVDSFIPAISGAMEPLKRIGEAFRDIWNLIFTSTEAMETWESIFSGLGKFLGGAFKFTLEAIATILEGIKISIEAIKEVREKGLWEAFKESVERGRESGGPTGYERMFGTRRVDDAILRPNGTVIETNPKDTLVAIKDLGTSLGGLMSTRSGGSTTVTNTFDFTGMQIVVPEGSGPEYGEEIGMSLIEKMRTEYNRDFERFGYA